MPLDKTGIKPKPPRLKLTGHKQRESEAQPVGVVVCGVMGERTNLPGGSEIGSAQ